MNKKLLAIGLLAMVMAPFVAFGEGGIDTGGAPVVSPPATVGTSQICSGIADCTYSKLVGKDGLIDKVINFMLFAVALPIAVIALVVAGVMLVAKPGVPDAREKAKKIIKSVILGFIVALAAYLIVKAIVTGLAGENTGLQSIFK